MKLPKKGTYLPIMGKQVPLAEALFSKTQRLVLGLLYGQPERSFYLKEIIDISKVGRGTVQRELEKFASSGLLSLKSIGNQKHYQANKDSPIYQELAGIIRKTVGLADVLSKALERKVGIDVAFVFGSIASGMAEADSDVDVCVIGNIAFAEVVKVLSKCQKKIQRDINPVVMPRKLFIGKYQKKDQFVTRIVQEERIYLIGTDHDFRQLIEDRTT